MKRKDLAVFVVIVASTLLIGTGIGRRFGRGSDYSTEITTEVVTDTLVYSRPEARSQRPVGLSRYRVPEYMVVGFSPRLYGDTLPCYSDGHTPCAAARLSELDSVEMELPMVQRHYGDSAYEVWVSGPLDPRLDSVKVFAPTTIMTKREWKPPRRWHIGVTAGYGYGPKGLQPYIGVGITYSIISF